MSEAPVFVLTPLLTSFRRLTPSSGLNYFTILSILQKYIQYNNTYQVENVGFWSSRDGGGRVGTSLNPLGNRREGGGEEKMEGENCSP